MKENASISPILLQIKEYKKKYYQNQLIRGLFIGLSIILITFLVISTSEYFGHFSQILRAVLFFFFLSVCSYVFFFLVFKPIFYLIGFRKSISDEGAAQLIGSHFPEIKDKLLNTLQLSSMNTSENDLIQASIQQKSNELTVFKFDQAIDFTKNKKFLPFLLIPFFITLFILLASPSFFSSSTERIVYFRKNFIQQAPFSFILKNENLSISKGDNFTVILGLNGSAFPDDVYLVHKGRKFKMERLSTNNTFNFTFSTIEDDIAFYFEAGGFQSNTFKVTVLSKPTLNGFQVEVSYPVYLNKPSEVFQNQYDFIVPMGSTISWQFDATDTKFIDLIFDNKQKTRLTSGLLGGYQFSKKLISSTTYSVHLVNEVSSAVTSNLHQIEVIADAYPAISLEQTIDSTFFQYLGFSGQISDDYGLSSLSFNYRLVKEKSTSTSSFKKKFINIDKNSKTQNYSYLLELASTNIQPGDFLEYYFEVGDNDGLQGSKFTKTSLNRFIFPSSSLLSKDITKDISNSENQLERILSQSRDLQEQLKSIQNKIKKNEFDNTDKRAVQQLLRDREKLQNEVNDLKNKLAELQKKQALFEKPSPQITEKMQQLQQIIQDLLSKEDTKLFEELKKMLEENTEKDLQDQLDKIQQNDRNLNRNIDRSLRMFKNLQLQQKIESAINQLESISSQEDKLASEEKENLASEQEKVNDAFEQVKQNLKKAEQLSKELRKETDLEKDLQREISNDLDKIDDLIQKKLPSEAQNQMKRTAQKMKKMADKLAGEMQSGEMKQMNEDIDALRALLDNLLKLSFDQERLMKELRGISKFDPKINLIAQEQLKLSSDAKMVEDSLYSLANRVLQIQSFVTREVTTMRNSIDETLQLVKDKKYPQAASKQQFSMTSINNLALLLSDTFSQMQQMMANQGSGKSKGKNKNPSSIPSFGERQNDINKKLNQLQGEQQSGKQLSQELVRLAQEQAKLRKELSQAQQKLKGTELGKKIGDELNEIQKQMDESENDLINKRINPSLQKRQKDVQTRLLEVDRALKEQELDPNRKGNPNFDYTINKPAELDKFIKKQNNQIEFIKSIPTNLSPFYKSQSSNYFKRIN
ncbi:MAG: DUF4175 family protein [Spirosomataceae bacterium]